MNNELRTYTIFIFFSALFVYCVSHFKALTGQYVINDDVRQQIYWMQQWLDPGLFQNDILTRYARNYVPWGVQAIYYAASFFINPVQFSKVLSLALFIANSLLIFRLALEFKDKRTALLAVCLSFFFTCFMRKISGGLSQSFAFPLLAAHLIFLIKGNLTASSCVIALQSVLNPYVFLISLVTQFIYLARNYAWALMAVLCGKEECASVARVDSEAARCAQEGAVQAKESLKYMVLSNLPVVAGVMLMAVKFVLPGDWYPGELVTRADMAGNPEYSALGRYEIFPVPSFFYELLRPWLCPFPFQKHPLTSWLGVAAITMAVGSVCSKSSIRDYASGFRVFLYLIPASIILYVASRIWLTKLFLPERYLELTLQLLYLFVTAVAIKMTLDRFNLGGKIYPYLATSLVVVSAVLSSNVGIYDFSGDKDIYQFMRTIPKDSLVAGHPELMDNIPTFGLRKAFVTYELSHTWVKPYWQTIKKRTYDLFSAYYADDPATIRDFCRYYGIDYFVIRDMDFDRSILKSGYIYFEPFGTEIRKMTAGRRTFAILDEKNFPAVYNKNGVRIIRIDREQSETHSKSR